MTLEVPEQSLLGLDVEALDEKEGLALIADSLANGGFFFHGKEVLVWAEERNPLLFGALYLQASRKKNYWKLEGLDPLLRGLFADEKDDPISVNGLIASVFALSEIKGSLRDKLLNLFHEDIEKRGLLFNNDK